MNARVQVAEPDAAEPDTGGKHEPTASSVEGANSRLMSRAERKPIKCRLRDILWVLRMPPLIL